MANPDATQWPMHTCGRRHVPGMDQGAGGTAPSLGGATMLRRPDLPRPPLITPHHPPALGNNLQISTRNMRTGPTSPHISAASARAGGANMHEDGEFPLSRATNAQTGDVILPTGDASLQTGGDIVLSATASTRTGAAILPTGGASLHIPGQNPENDVSAARNPRQTLPTPQEKKTPSKPKTDFEPLIDADLEGVTRLRPDCFFSWLLRGSSSASAFISGSKSFSGLSAYYRRRCRPLCADSPPRLRHGRQPQKPSFLAAFLTCKKISENILHHWRTFLFGRCGMNHDRASSRRPARSAERLLGGIARHEPSRDRWRLAGELACGYAPARCRRSQVQGSKARNSLSAKSSPGEQGNDNHECLLERNLKIIRHLSDVFPK